ncbi:CaiB/BaiF CoA transferase family protein [Tenuibacillus multivorans]|uniref:Crotonobetainyl-CoA:carnitine CoA-transferase CaiB n=1 Tax=Tenuibacillus multivorans TaxID=237069 RepID=A0A1G9WDI1_9BACI|nr:CaiB/BaiF CoA-transferase family protein [Tenuibacillus multivorans]GEL76407.1 CoA transferase [Tenuibacillus multivorans]SDM82357.1 Crotonobetainyl-CoA:carnitine CoA-transferase CaiB [Tenuibacillus multivorans]
MLQGLRVIDFSQYLPGPFATLRLVDWGAEVIKVEPPQGDPARGMAKEALFAVNNRGKKSVAINLKEEKGQNLALDLIKKADVVVESFRPGVMNQFGLGYDHAKSVNEKIVYLSLTGFGQNSPYRDQGSHDSNYLAMSGMLSQLKDVSGRPIHPTNTLADLIGGIAASEAITAALFQREKTGNGTYIDLAMTDAIFNMMGNHVMLSLLAQINSGIPVLNGSSANYHIYKTKDERFMTLGALEYKFWKNFCEAVGRVDWLESYPDHLTDQNLFEEVEQLFLTKPQSEWTEIGEEHDCCLFPVLEIGEAVKSAYVKERDLIKNNMFVQTHYQSAQDGVISTAKLSEHTDEVLSKLLNKDPQEIQRLRTDGVI